MNERGMKTIIALVLASGISMGIYGQAYIIKVPEGSGSLSTYYIKDGKVQEIFQEVKERLGFTSESDSFAFLEYKDSIIIFSTLFEREIVYGKMDIGDWIQLLDLTGWPNGVSETRSYQFDTYSIFHIERSGSSIKYGTRYILKMDNQTRTVSDSMVLYDSKNKLPRLFNGTYRYKQPGGNSSFFFSKISFFDYTIKYPDLAIDGYGRTDPINGYGIYSINKDMKIAYYNIKEEIVVPGEKMNGVDVVPCLLDKVNPGFTVLKSYYDNKNDFKVKYRTFMFDYEKGTAQFVEEGYIGGSYTYAIYELPRENREYPTVIQLTPEEAAKIKVIKFEEDGTQERINRDKGMLYVSNIWEVKNTALFEKIVENPPVKELTYDLSDFDESIKDKLDK